MTTSEKSRFWQQHLDRWPTSGMTQVAYCQAHGLKLATFQYWRKRLREMTAPVDSGAFVPVVVRDARYIADTIIVVRIGPAMLDVPLSHLSEVLQTLGLGLASC